MSKRRSYEQKLLDDLYTLPGNRFFNFTAKKDFEKMLEHIKIFIDCGEPFELNETYTSVRRVSDEVKNTVYHKMDILPAGISIKKISRGTMFPVEVQIKKQTKTVNAVVENSWYEVYRDGKMLQFE